MEPPSWTSLTHPHPFLKIFILNLLLSLLSATTLVPICNQQQNHIHHPHQSANYVGGRVAPHCGTISNRSVNTSENHMRGTGEVKASTILSYTSPSPPSLPCFCLLSSSRSPIFQSALLIKVLQASLWTPEISSCKI